jgi:hypothetical protein
VCGFKEFLFVAQNGNHPEEDIEKVANQLSEDLAKYDYLNQI